MIPAAPNPSSRFHTLVLRTLTLPTKHGLQPTAIVFGRRAHPFNSGPRDPHERQETPISPTALSPEAPLPDG